MCNHDWIECGDEKICLLCGQAVKADEPAPSTTEMILPINQVLHGNSLEVLKTIPTGTINTCITSPPYWGLRDYGVEEQIGLEKTPEEYVSKMVEIFREVKRVLRDDGTLWLNLGDSYAGSWGNYAPTGQGGQRPKNTERWQRRAYEDKADWRPPTSNKHEGLKPKDLVGIPWMVAFALRADGWYLRQDIIWHKPNCMPESVKDRCTKAHEYIFLLSKSRRYYYDHEVIKEPAAYDGRKDTLLKGSPKYEKGIVSGQVTHPMAAKGHERWKKNERGEYVRNKRSVWTIPTKPFKEAHFATFPEKLIEPCILAGCPEGGIVLDPFMGSGTTAVVALKHNRNYIGIELNPEYIEIARQRINAAREQFHKHMEVAK
jgi:DNA modification methylase